LKFLDDTRDEAVVSSNIDKLQKDIGKLYQ